MTDHTCLWCSGDMRWCPCSLQHLRLLQGKLYEALQLLLNIAPYSVTSPLISSGLLVGEAILQRMKFETSPSKPVIYTLGPWENHVQTENFPNMFIRKFENLSEGVYTTCDVSDRTFYINTQTNKMVHAEFDRVRYKTQEEAKQAFDLWALKQGWTLK
jgi:hypothetical protein